MKNHPEPLLRSSAIKAPHLLGTSRTSPRTRNPCCKSPRFGACPNQTHQEAWLSGNCSGDFLQTITTASRKNADYSKELLSNTSGLQPNRLFAAFIKLPSFLGPATRWKHETSSRLSRLNKCCTNLALSTCRGRPSNFWSIWVSWKGGHRCRDWHDMAVSPQKNKVPKQNAIGKRKNTQKLWSPSREGFLFLGDPWPYGILIYFDSGVIWFYGCFVKPTRPLGGRSVNFSWF